ncbi:MAG: hypothetical protein BWY60_00753 [Actinobacteria bacterium ADurb.Bin346]|nr:MAG: hypothetical protein BWY60_00753 [Actinobacteria bacterium ADurb.Bin346]
MPTKPASWAPIKAINRPMPTPIAYFSPIGMAFMRIILSFVRTIIRTSRPSITIIPIACCHVIPSPSIIVNVTTAFIPIPEASAKGVFETSPIMMLIMPAPRHVDTTAASKGMPVAPPLERIAGLTNIMYAIVMNVVTPATISRLTVVFLSWNLKYDKAPSLSS